MNRLIILSFLLLTSFGVQAQDIPNELLKTWMPILSQDYTGDTTYKEDLYFITFNRDGGHFELPEQKFKFDLSQDSLNITIETGEFFRLKLVELEKDRLVLFHDSSLIITYIPLPNFEQTIDLNILESSLSNSVWSFNLPNYKNSFFDFNVEFYDILQDSSIVNYQYINTLKTAILYSPNNVGRMLWYVDKHHTTPVIHIKQMFGSFLPIENLIIKDIGKDKMTFAFWSGGLQIGIEARKWKKKSVRKQNRELENLTRQAWRVREEITPKSKGSGLDAILNQYFIEFEGLNYQMNSTLFISQEDIDNHSLILKFDQTGVYSILREDQILDEGRWNTQFNNTVILLKSNRVKDSFNDGILGGYIDISQLKKNKLVIYRSFNNSIDLEQSTNQSKQEIYRPIR
jgi:hypothetical protein